MGASPTAARADDTFIYKKDYVVDDHVGGGKNLDFEEGAAVAVVNPSSSDAMLATTGSVSIPAGYALPVAVDATSLVPGTYVVMQAASGITDLSQFDATATVGDGASASFSVVDGKLVMTVTATSSVASQTWRPASSADLGWNTSSENWLYDGGATGGFIPYVPAFIDGAETATGDITVSGTMTAGPITLTGANDYTFKGSGTIAGGDTVTLGGTGTITLDGPNFGGQDIAITNGQKVVLGFNAGANALGTDSGSSGGKVSVAAGSQLNLNDTGLAGAADPRSEATQLKTFVIAGDGADGRGAIVNDALDGRSSHGYQNSALRRVELADDATIGGADRIDLRARSGTAATATPGIYGPEKTLTIKNSVWLANWSQPIEVGAIVIPAGGMFLPVQMTEAMFDIPGGITLDGGTIDHYQNTYPTNMPFFVTANGGKFQSGGGASTVKGDVTVASGATLAMTGDQNVTYAGAFDAAGATVANSCTKATYFNGTSSGLAITQSAGTNYLQNVVSGDLAITQTAGINYLKSVVSGDVTVTKSAGDSYLRSGFSGTDVNFTQTGGNGGFYIDNGTAFVLDTLTFSASGGSLYGWTYNTDAEADVTGTVDFGSTAGANFFVLGSAGAKGLAIKAVGNTKQFGAGHSSARPGALRLKSGTNLTVSDLCTGCVSTPSRGQLVVESGATVTASRFINGYYAGVPAEVSTHRTDIYGTVTATGNGYITMDAPRGEVYIHEGGVLTTPTLYSMRRNNVAPWGYGTGCGVSDGRQWLLLDGGRLEMGSLSGKSMPGTTKIDLYNGTVANTKSFGATQGIAVFFGHDAAGGEVELNLKSGTYLNLNTALSGASSVTLTGSGYVGGTRSAVGGVYQGALLGKFTVATTGATTNDLRNASAFMGGLAVAAGAHASVGKYSEEHYPFALTITSSGCYAHGLFVTNDFSYPYVAADAWTYAHKYCASSARPYGNYAEWGLRSEFYVPAEKAGTWTFSGSYDDYLILQIDGETLCNIMYTNPIPCQVTLSEGWHRLTVATADNTGSAGASTKNNWKDGKAFGFIVGESASTDGNDYTAFKPGADLGDGLTLDVRPAVNACVWSYCTNKPATTTWLTLADSDASWSHIKCLDTVEYIHLTGENAAADTLKYFSGKLSKFEGWFKVEDGKEGDWEFKMAYDDFHRFTVDGTELITRKSSSSETVTGNATLTAGWHRWEAVIGDGSGAWGRRTYNGGYALSYKAPGESAHSRFDETNLKLAATLGDIAVLEPSGIYKELEIGAGATLTSSGTMAMPIFGTLKGTGTLAGSFAFAGTTNCWEVTGAVATSATLPAATFSDATAETFAGLKSVSVLFDARPRRRAYYLTGAIDGLTAADAPAAAVVVKDAAGSDYSANFALTVKDGRLALSNGKPFSGMIILVK